MKIAVLIPAYEPDQRLPELVRQLSAQELEVLVVNDGSTAGLEHFAALRDLPGVTVLGYERNQGKGAALKAGLAALAERGFEGVVTADSDGQHTLKDILGIVQAMEETPGQLILGAREVEKMPPKSKTGNNLTRKLFGLLYGVKLRDTQTGLRGIPLTQNSTPGLLALPGKRYEFEMEMLRDSQQLFPAGIREIPIETVYIDENSGTHFRPLKDGARIYRVLFHKLPGFILSSAVAFGLDYLLFNLLYYQVLPSVTGATVISTVAARLCSGTCNYLVNKNLLFKDSGGKYTFLNYWKLAVCILIANMLIMHVLVDVLHLPAFLMKIIVEILLFSINFTVQHSWSRNKED